MPNTDKQQKNSLFFSIGKDGKKNVQKILLKLSGELLRPLNHPFGIDSTAAETLVQALCKLYHEDLLIGIVIGGGNLIRGATFQTKITSRPVADQMGMLATILNGLLLREALSSSKVPTTLLSAIECPKLVESFSWIRLQEAIKNKHILIFVGGTGNPFFSTDSAAALRASEMGADLLIKLTKVDGIYEQDPFLYPNSKKIPFISYDTLLEQNLGIMDPAAISICRNNKIPIFVTHMDRLYTENLESILNNPQKGSWIFASSS